MKDSEKPRDQLIEELATARKLIAELVDSAVTCKQAEMGLKDSEEKYRAHFSLTNDVIFVLDSQYRVTSVSPSVENVLGYRSEDMRGRPFQDLDILHPDDLDRAAAEVRHVLSGRKISSSVYRFITSVGVTRYGEVSGVPITKDGHTVGVVSVVRDITERRRAEAELKDYRDHLEALVAERTADLTRTNEQLIREAEERKSAQKALRESEARHHAVVDAFDGLIYVCSQDYRIQFMNQRLIDRTGRDATGELCHAALHGLDRVCPWCVNEQVWMGETVRWEIESPKDGRWYYVSNSPIYHPDGTMSKQALIMDITERKHAEEELKKHRDHLQELVRVSTADLTKAFEQLMQENEARKKTEDILRAREIELEEKQHDLEEMNSTLRVLLKQREEDKAHMEGNIMKNLRSSVLPYLEKLRSSGLRDGQSAYLAEIELRLKEIASTFIKEVSAEYIGLSPCEIRVAVLIKEGRSSKEIADLLNISMNTVMYHRHHIRRKTGLRGKKINLQAYLETLN